MPPHPKPDRQRVLQRSGVDGLPGEGRPVLARPVDMGMLTKLQQKLQLFCKQRIVVVEVQSEERKGLNERAPPRDNLRPAMRKQIERGKLLKHTDRIGGAQHRDRAGEPDAASAGRGRRQDHGRRGIQVLSPVMFPDAERVQANLVGQRDCLEPLAQVARGVDGLACGGVKGGGHKTINANLHTFCQALRYQRLIFALRRASGTDPRRRSGRSGTPEARAR